MSPDYRASIVDAMHVLNSITKKNNFTLRHCDIPASAIEKVTHYKDTTNAYLIELSRKNSCNLATLGEALVNAKWAMGLVFNPFDK